MIGCGYWGGNYIRLLRGRAETQVVACDLDPRRLADLSQRYPGLQVERDHQQLLARDDIDAVIVATTAAQHYPIARAALAAGKDLLVEKPMTMRAAESWELVETAQAQGRILMVGHTFLYHPAVRMMRDYVRRGEIGSTYYLHATRTHLGLVRRDVNAVWDLATHDISIFGYLLDARPLSVSAMGGRFLSQDRHDVAFISLEYPGGVIGNIFVSWVDSNKMREVAVIGSRARIVFDDLNNLERLKIYHKGVSLDRPYASFGEFQLLVRDGDIISPRVEMLEPLHEMTEHFLRCLVERRQPHTSGSDGAEVVVILEGIDRSLAANGTPTVLQWPEDEPAR